MMLLTAVSSVRHQGAQTPAALLIPEVLAEVFNQSRPGFAQRTKWSTSWVKAAGVCRLWRSVALDTPYLWNEIDLREAYRERTVDMFLERSAHCPLLVALDCMCNVETILSILKHISRIQVLIVRNMDPNHEYLFRRVLSTPPPTLRYLSLFVTGTYHSPIENILSDMQGSKMQALVLNRVTVNTFGRMRIFPPQLKELRIMYPIELSSFRTSLTRIIEVLSSLPSLETVVLDRLCRVDSLLQDLGLTTELHADMSNLKVLELHDSPRCLKAMLKYITFPTSTALTVDATASPKRSRGPGGQMYWHDSDTEDDDEVSEDDSLPDNFESFIVTKLGLGSVSHKDTRFVAVHFASAVILRLWTTHPPSTGEHWNRSSLPRLTFISTYSSGGPSTRLELLWQYLQLDNLEYLALHGDPSLLRLPRHRRLALLSSCPRVHRLSLGLEAEKFVPLEKIVSADYNLAEPFLFPTLERLELVHVPLASAVRKDDDKETAHAKPYGTYLEEVIKARHNAGLGLLEVVLSSSDGAATVQTQLEQYVPNVEIKPSDPSLKNNAFESCTMLSRPVLGLYL